MTTAWGGQGWSRVSVILFSRASLLALAFAETVLNDGEPSAVHARTHAARKRTCLAYFVRSDSRGGWRQWAAI